MNVQVPTAALWLLVLIDIGVSVAGFFLMNLNTVLGVCLGGILGICSVVCLIWMGVTLVLRWEES